MGREVLRDTIHRLRRGSNRATWEARALAQQSASEHVCGEADIVRVFSKQHRAKHIFDESRHTGACGRLFLCLDSILHGRRLDLTQKTVRHLEPVTEVIDKVIKVWHVKYLAATRNRRPRPAAVQVHW